MAMEQADDEQDAGKNSYLHRSAPSTSLHSRLYFQLKNFLLRHDFSFELSTSEVVELRKSPVPEIDLTVQEITPRPALLGTPRFRCPPDGNAGPSGPIFASVE